MDDYRTVADAVAADITAGRLRPGDRLAPQRAFARRHGIANSTAIRVYAELARCGASRSPGRRRPAVMSAATASATVR